MNAQIVWLEGSGVDLGEVGPRAYALAQLAAVGLNVPRAFCLGRSVLYRLTGRQRPDAGALLAGKLPGDLQRDVKAAINQLGGSVAIRRSPLDRTRDTGDSNEWQVTTRGGRPERETYLNLTDVAEVTEAVRRIWGIPSTSVTPRPPVAIVVQRFILPEVCALVRQDRVDADALHVLSSLGVGDLLSAGLVVPDRHTIRRHDGRVLASSLGRKAQMTIAQIDGGVTRVPVPASAARKMAVDDDKLVELARTWRIAESACGPLFSLAICWSGGRWHVTTAVPGERTAQDGVMLG